ncbi:MAG: TauD/TfdA family dioxygenase [Ectothiorhodospiraceae bacterium]|nr:TauD/TfdA family dioxygenase [Ectothiorhodospiraceae bacterium]
MATVAQATVAGPSIRPLGSALGAEVTGVDLSRRVDDDTFARIHRAFLEHHFLVFRDQALTVEQQIAFSERFGPLEAFPEKDKQKDAATVYNVANVTADGKKLGSKDIQVIFLKVNARWHTDSSYRSVPSLASLLYCIEPLPDEAVGGETEYANMFAAHDALPEDLRRQLEPLHMVHYYEYGRRLYPELPPMTHHERVHVPPVCHPVIRVHPDRGGKRSLFFTENAGGEIGGMPLAQGQALHRQLVEHVTDPRFSYKHRWRKGDLGVWDNRCLLHRLREYDEDRYRRVLRRTTVAGAGPVVGPFSRQ